MAWRKRVHAAAVALAVAAVLQGCASTPPPTPPKASVATTPPAPPPASPAPSAVATPGLTPRARVLKILQLLNDGQRDPARAEAVQLLRDEPDNVLGKSLFDQIDKDPRELLGERSFPYRLQPGDSLSSVAQRFLGDRFLFYALARYNGIDKPGEAEVGRTLLIPGVPDRTPPRAARPARPESDEAAVDARLRKPAPAPPPTKPVHDPARASALRGEALAALNRGAADRAAALLRQAAALAPESAVIARDLARAERILAGTHR